jgi:hypothetical protein
MEIEKESAENKYPSNVWFSKRNNQIVIAFVIFVIVLAGFGISSLTNEDTHTSAKLLPFNVTFEPLSANMFIEQFTLNEGETKTFERDEFLDNVTELYFYLLWQDVQFIFPDEIRFKIIPPEGCNATFTPSNEVKVYSSGYDTNQVEIKARVLEMPKNTTILASTLKDAAELVNATYCHDKAEGIWSMEVECLGDGSMNLDTGQMDSYSIFHYVEIFKGNVTEG